MMTLAINIPITEQDIKHVEQSNDLCELYTVQCKDLWNFVHHNVTDKCIAVLQLFTLMFKGQFHAQDDRF